MGDVWVTVFSALTLLEYFSFYYVIYGRRLQLTLKRGIGLATVFLVSALMCLFWQEQTVDLQMCIVFLVSFFMMFCLFQVSFKENVRLWLAALMILVLIEGMVDDFIRIFISVGEQEATLIYLVCVLVLLWAYHFFVGRKLDVNMFRLPKRINWIVGIMAMVLVLVMNFMSFLLFEHVERPLARVGEVFLFLGSMAICVLLFSLIYFFNVTQEYSMKAEVLERQNEQQREYFEQLLRKEQDTRQFRHDLIAELLELKNYFEKGEYIKLNDYLSEMLGEVSEISKRQYDVGNEIVNKIGRAHV